LKEMKQIAYVMGPMTGFPDENRPAFRTAAAWIRENINVDEVISADELDSSDPVADKSPAWVDYIRRDLPHVARATVAYALPGWRQSRGATLEATIFNALRVPVYELTIGLSTAYLERVQFQDLPAAQHPSPITNRGT
jgi:hypothetical protein